MALGSILPIVEMNVGTIYRLGTVIFDVPVLGNTLWHATAVADLSEGTRVRIVEVNGQLFEVEKNLRKSVQSQRPFERGRHTGAFVLGEGE